MITVKKLNIPTRPKRRFLKEDLELKSWNDLEPYFKELQVRELDTVRHLLNWMFDRSELEAYLSENLAWRYIKMNCDNNKENTAAYEFFVNEIEPKIAPYDNAFNKKLIACPILKQIDKYKYYVYLRGVRKHLEIYRDENIPLFSEMKTKEQNYGAIVSELAVTVDGEEMTLHKAAKFLKNTDRKKREEVYQKIQTARLGVKNQLDDLFNELITLRHKVSTNAGFGNYRDYMFTALGRFDYDAHDCEDFHDAIKKEIVPLIENFDLHAKKSLNVESYKPWDTEVDISGKPALHPFDTGEEMLQKSIDCFNKVKPEFAEYLEIMREMGHLDLEARKGKSPGGFNYPLYEIGAPFIFMNAVGTLRDVVTMVHEGGHAVHSFLSKNLKLTEFKSVPSEVAELASMSMELFSMEHWDVFFSNADDLKRAKKEQLEKVLRTLAWVATIDKFQHWLYLNPKHTNAERISAWKNIYTELGSNVLDWSGSEDAFDYTWQKQLHLYEVPFYYIEYGFAQLGAIAMWRNYKTNPEKTLAQYRYALSLGYTKTIPDLYKAAGIKFDFSDAYVKELALFVKVELEAIN